jgi:hypothetical protein
LEYYFQAGVLSGIGTGRLFGGLDYEWRLMNIENIKPNLAPTEWQAAYAQGQVMNLDQAVEFILALPGD